MGTINPSLPTPGDPRGTEETDARNALVALLNLVNGNIDAANITDGTLTTDELQLAVREALGVNSTGVKRRGKSIISAQESRTNVAYGMLPTPDLVSGIVLPTDGLIAISYKAIWRESVNATASATISLGADQLKVAVATAPSAQSTALGAGAANIWNALNTYAGGLNSSASATSHGSDVTTGELVGSFQTIGGPGGGTMSIVLGGVCYVFAAAGTYDVSVQFRSTSGQVDVKERRLWVWTMAF